MKKASRRKRIARLTPEENRVWEHAFNYWKDKGCTDTRADDRAWRDMQHSFPRLKNYDGCQ